MKYILCFILLMPSCKEKGKDKQFIEELNAAILQKTSDSIELGTFKLENSGRFRTFDSLKKINKITVEQQKVHDSLFQKGISLAMKFVKDKIKMNDLQKEQ